MSSARVDGLTKEHLRALRFHARRISSGRDRSKGARDDECISVWSWSGPAGGEGFGMVTPPIVDELRGWGLIEIRDHDWKNCMTRITEAGWTALSAPAQTPTQEDER